MIETEQEAREIANKREQLQREQGLRTQKRLTLGDISHRIARGEFHELNVIVKGDTDGSVEALSDSFIKLSTEKVQVNVVNKAVGQISENDVMLASASDAIIVGFQVRPSADARKAADREGVEINTYSIIYDAIDDIKSAMIGMLDKVKKEITTGQVEVRQVFKISKVGTVAGCLVTEGKVHSKDKGRVVRVPKNSLMPDCSGSLSSNSGKILRIPDCFICVPMNRKTILTPSPTIRNFISNCVNTFNSC